MDGYYNFRNVAQNVVPYLALGAGNGEFDGGARKDEETLVNLGGGVRFLLDRGFSIIGDLRAVNSLDNETTSGLGTLGLAYTFGGNNKQRSSKGEFEISEYGIPDTDNDGINDQLDECPSTPAGVAVLPNGCGLDGDGDKVADYLDECAQTPADVAVDPQGCPRWTINLKMSM